MINLDETRGAGWPSSRVADLISNHSFCLENQLSKVTPFTIDSILLDTDVVFFPTILAPWESIISCSAADVIFCILDDD